MTCNKHTYRALGKAEKQNDQFILEVDRSIDMYAYVVN